MFIVVISSGGLSRYITSPTFSLTISRLWYLLELDLVNQPRGVSEPTHVVPIRPCHDVYSSLQCSYPHRHRHCHRHRHSCLIPCLWPSNRIPVSPGCGYFMQVSIRVYVRLLWSRLQSGDTLTHGHVCACPCCFSSFKFVIVMLLLVCVRYRYLILVDIWLISTPGVFLKIASGNWSRVWHVFQCVPIRVDGQ